MSTVAEIAAAGTLTFHQALLQAEAQARSTLDETLHERLSAATALVKDGRVFQTATGVWEVDSVSREGLTYRPNGTCSCEDHHFNKPRYCKHQLGAFLAMRVQALMRPPAAPVVPELVEPWPDNDPEPAPPAVETEPPAPSHPAGTAALPEARSSANVRIQVCGHDVQITLRDHDESTLLARLTTLLAQYPAAAKPAAQGQADTTPQCPTHGVLRQGKRGWFYPRQLDDGTWCKSKAT